MSIGCRRYEWAIGIRRLIEEIVARSTSTKPARGAGSIRTTPPKQGALDCALSGNRPASSSSRSEWSDNRAFVP